MRRVISFGVVSFAAAAAIAGYAFAQEDMVAKRQALMKDNGAQATVAGQMIKGDTPFDAAAAKAAMEKIAANAAAIPARLPGGKRRWQSAAGDLGQLRRLRGEGGRTQDGRRSGGRGDRRRIWRPSAPRSARSARPAAPVTRPIARQARLIRPRVFRKGAASSAAPSSFGERREHAGP